MRCLIGKRAIGLLSLSVLTTTLAATGAPAAEEEEPARLEYSSKRREVLRASKDLDHRPYLAFPSVLRLDPTTVLISYKRGRAHGGDPGAQLEMMRYDVPSGRVVETKIIGGRDDLIFQMGEWVKFPNGDVANYVDVQKIVPSPNYRNNHRTGIYFTRSRDGGKSFSPMRKMGPVDGVEYGYAFEDVTVGSRVFMLVMTFPELVGKIGEEAWQYGKVHAIVSDDNGETWSHVHNLSEEFGSIDINESSFVRVGDRFLVTTRGYHGMERLHLTTADFKLIRQVNLTKAYSCVKGVIGRPRLFARDGAIYLHGRNYTDPMSLALYKVNPGTLQLQTYVVLDQGPGDGYYAEPFFVDKDGKTVFNTITYKKAASGKPDILRLEFPWEQISGISIR